MNITNSPDISSLSVQVTWDLSGTNPVIRLVNQSTGNNLSNVSWAFVALSPTQTAIHNGSINSPDIVGDWSTHVLNDQFPKPMNQIEWSGLPYSFQVIAKDSNGSVYTNPVQLATICRPFGNTQYSKNSFGLASSDVTVKCQQARIFFQDTTYHSYQGLDGTQISSTLSVQFPIDETGQIPSPFIIGQYSTALVPISYSSPNYQFLQNEVYDYNLGNDSLVRIKYQLLSTFTVACNVDLQPLVCEINKLTDTVISGNCADVVEAQKKLGIIMSKFALVVIGIQQPLTGVDVAKTVQEIIEIGNFDCNCCGSPTGIIPVSSSIIDGYNFVVNKLGGDVNGNFTINGSNITLNIGDVSYVVTVGSTSPSSVNAAFSFTPSLSGDGFTKTYTLNVDGAILAQQILTTISESQSLINFFNTLITGTGAGGGQLIVDGGCIFSSGSACDYTFLLEDIPLSPSNALLGLDLGTRQIPPSFAFNLNTLPALQSYLNGLGYGTFTVANPVGTENVLITSHSNPNNINGILYKLTRNGSILHATMTKVCTGFVPKSANEVVQSIIDYLCGITDAEVVTSQDYVINYIGASNTEESVTVPTGTNIANFIIELLDREADTISYILSLSKLNCANVQNLFPPSIAIMQDTDFLLGTKANDCARIYPVEFGTAMLNIGMYNLAFMDALCKAVSACAGGYSCEPYTVLNVTTQQHSPSDNLMNITIQFTHPTAVKNTIRYARIDNTNTPTYITIPNVLAGDSPYVINDLPVGQYFVGMTPIYADGRTCSEIPNQTAPCTGINGFNLTKSNESFHIYINYQATCPYIKVIMSLPNSGTYENVYANTGNPIDINIQNLNGIQSGTYSISLQPCCNLTTGFFGNQTAQQLITIPVSNNSSFVNNSGSAMNDVSLSSYADGISNVFNSASIAGSGGSTPFYIADGFYNSLVLNINTGTITSGSLTTGTGTYVGALTGSHKITFSNINVVNGISINLS
jgi:hypothetical protein